MGWSLASKSQSSINTSGNWAFSRGTTDISDAGLDLSNTASSGITGQTTVNLMNINKEKNYRVSIKRVDSNWNSNLIITATKESDGVSSPPNKTITINPLGTAASVIVTNLNQVFFTLAVGTNCNSCSLNNITVRYQISGISVTLPAANYSTEIQYTISDI